MSDGEPQEESGAEIGRLPEVAGELDRALALVEFLRKHCPWDRAQTSETLIPYLLEESHEVVDAIRSADWESLEGELGDLLLNVAFQVVLAEEAGDFDRARVVQRLEDKMIRRHPHLFGLGEKESWEVLKVRELADDEGVLTGLATGLDPLLRAHRMQEKASGIGFDWEDADGAWAKVAEELEEVREAMESGNPEGVSEELGDLLFSVVNLTRLAGLHATNALDRANTKFKDRFGRLEGLARTRGLRVEESSLEKLDAMWEEVKRDE